MRTGVHRLEHRVFLLRIIVFRPADKPPDPGLPIPPLGREHLGRLPATSIQFADVRLFQLAEQLSIGNLPQFIHRRHIDAGIGIDDVFAIRRVTDLMSSISIGQRSEPATIEIDPVVMNQVGILPRILPGSAKPDLPLLFVDLIDIAKDVLALGDLPLLSRIGIDQVEVPPAILLGDIDNLPALLQPGHQRGAVVLRMLGPDKGLRLLIDDVTRLPGEDIDLDQAEALVSSVDLPIGEGAPIERPAHIRPAKINNVDLRLHMQLLVDIEPVELKMGELIPRQSVATGVEPGLAAASR